MAVDFISLAIIALVAAVVPVIARLIPGRLIPETVFLLFIGAILGPSVLGWLAVDETISFLSELGVAFLFLLAGFEIEPRNLAGTQGKHALGTWLVSFAIALAFVYFAGIGAGDRIQAIAVAIALTSTALGTLLPILKERGLTGTRLGDTVIAYGKLRHASIINKTCLICTPAYENSTPVHMCRKTIPSPVEFSALVTDLGCCNHNHIRTAFTCKFKVAYICPICTGRKAHHKDDNHRN